MNELDCMNDTIIIFRTKRFPPIRTLLNYPIPKGYSSIILADPDVYEAHKQFYPLIGYAPKVVMGARGLGAQSALCYSEAAKAGYPYYFRLDDDLEQKTFVSKFGDYPQLGEVILNARECLDETKTTLAGFANGSNRYWMKEGYKRTWGLIHGGANISISALNSEPYMDPTLARGEDIWRTCVHRKMNGAVGRVQWIGFDKKKSTITAGQSTMANLGTEKILAAKEKILEKFEGMVTCNGMREINAGNDLILNWRMKKSKWDY